MASEWATSVDLHLELDAGGRRAALEAAVREAIRDGRLGAGDRLPSSRALAVDLGLARGTVTEAYAQLVAEGWLSARQGSATTVAAAAPEAPHREEPRRTPPPPRYDLRPGGPDVAAFPRTVWVAALRRGLRQAADRDLGYGDPLGHPRLRAVLAGYLGRARGVAADPSTVLVCSGWSQALDLFTKVLRARGATAVAMEDPCNAHYRSAVRAAGLEVVPVPVDEDGARVGELGPRLGAVVLTPAHQYPTGPVLAPERRAAVVDWARDTGGLVVEDDYDGELRYDRQPVGALQALDPGRVAYVGTTSKSLAPGLRLGWIVPPPDLLAPLGEAKHLADRHSSVFDQLALAELIDSGAYDRHLRRARLRYRRRRDLLLAELARRVPHLEPSGIAAGIHVVLSTGGRPEADVIADLAARGVGVNPLGPAHHQPGSGEPAVVIGYGSPPEHAFPAAVEALVAALDEVTR
jgi:GntR family transcriptional regulator / MocR family aminotransferase